MKALITGITGFAGSHLAELLLSRGFEVYGTVRWRSRLDNIQHIKDRLKLIEADLRDAHSTARMIKECQPDYIFHLAAQSFVHSSFHAPQDTLTTNVVGTVNLLEAVRSSGINPVIQIAGSSEEYGLVHEDEIPIKETSPLRPMSPYAVSKVAEDRLGYQYHKTYGMKIIITRAFNHEGPRRGEVFVTSNFAKQVAEIEQGKKNPAVIHVGNLESKRDFSDVRDVVRAYLLAVEKCTPGEAYNICSCRAWSIKSALDLLKGMSTAQFSVVTDQSRIRPIDVPLLLGDCTKFMKVTGWKSTIPFEKTMEDLLDYWRERV
jgi:GDP-4-dehydro-6-deoxy-D-mannose reductase